MAKQDPRTRLANRLRKLRAERGLTQEKVSQKAKISLQYLQMLESRTPKKNATIVTLEKLAAAYEMELWEFLRYED